MGDTLTLDDLSERWGGAQRTMIETVGGTTQSQWRWIKDGVVIHPKLMTERKMVRYEREWLNANGGPHSELGNLGSYVSPGGWEYATPYMDCPELLELCCDVILADRLMELTGEPMGVHLNLSGWRSTQRDWHFDQYLNEPYVGAFYAAVWIALDTVHPDSGPFEYVPGSHHWWKPISQAKMRAALGEDGHGPDWPTKSERILTPLFEAELTERDIKPLPFLGERGDVLIWHSKLLHRGSIPKDPHMERRGLIAHFSGIHHRPDFPDAVQHPAGGWYFPIGGRQPVALPTT